jgi:hypothetical protein
MDKLRKIIGFIVKKIRRNKKYLKRPAKQNLFLRYEPASAGEGRGDCGGRWQIIISSATLRGNKK